jgi:hypothetical protein
MIESVCQPILAGEDSMGGLDTNWLSAELDSIDGYVDRWGRGLRESYNSLFESNDDFEKFEVVARTEASAANIPSNPG